MEFSGRCTVLSTLGAYFEGRPGFTFSRSREVKEAPKSDVFLEKAHALGERDPRLLKGVGTRYFSGLMGLVGFSVFAY